MSSKKDAMKKKLENMHLGERINYGYRMVITMMLIRDCFRLRSLVCCFSIC